MRLNFLVNNIKDQLLSIDFPSRPLKLKMPSSTQINRLLDIDIKGISLNSKFVKKAYIFFCLSGSRYKGTDFINDAYHRGAKVVVTQDNIKLNRYKNLIVIRVKDVVSCLSFIANKFYGSPVHRLNITAITGTNGKTTITYIIENILSLFRKRVGVIGTINYRFGGKELDAKNTTPDILTTHNLLNKMHRGRVKYLLIEVSSHALAQRRVEGIEFDQAIFTNLTQDHFDYHKTKNNYFKSKSMLFTKYLRKNGVAIINIDDAYGFKLVNLLKKNKKCKIITYGIKNKADISTEDILFKRDGCSFIAKVKGHKFKINTNLIGLFNIYNILASIAACFVLNIPEKYLREGLKEIYIPGRLERIRYNRDINIFVDYAHTEDAIKDVLLTLKILKGSKRLIVVFGCGGDRDKDKRHKMGRVASRLADFVIISSDNPRFEDPKDIANEIKRGITKKNYTILIDRKKAIKKAIDIAKSGDIVVIAGKGHENYQIVKDRRIPFSDRAVIEDIMDRRGFTRCLN